MAWITMIKSRVGVTPTNIVRNSETHHLLIKFPRFGQILADAIDMTKAQLAGAISFDWFHEIGICNLHLGTDENFVFLTHGISESKILIYIPRSRVFIRAIGYLN